MLNDDLSYFPGLLRHYLMKCEESSLQTALEVICHESKKTLGMH